jgi:sRNA-binding protein
VGLFCAANSRVAKKKQKKEKTKKPPKKRKLKTEKNPVKNHEKNKTKQSPTARKHTHKNIFLLSFLTVLYNVGVRSTFSRLNLKSAVSKPSSRQFELGSLAFVLDVDSEIPFFFFS